MQNKILIIVILVFTLLGNSCKTETSFEDYLSNFREVKTPFSIIGWSAYRCIFPDAVYDNTIKPEYLNSFTQETDISSFNGSYNYGVKYKYGEYSVALISKFYDKQSDIYLLTLMRLF